MRTKDDRYSVGRAAPKCVRIFIFFALIALAPAFSAGAWAQYPTATVDFATSGLPMGVSVNVTGVSYHSAKNTFLITPPNGLTFASPGPDSSPNGTILTQPGTECDFSYPTSFCVGRTQYALQNVSPTSPFTTGVAGSTTHVVATFAAVAPASVDFATSGLPNGVSISLSVASSDPCGNPATTAVSFTSPGPSSAIATTAGTNFTYSGFPSSVTVSGIPYALQSVSPASGLLTGGAGSSTDVVATYAPAATPPTVTAPADQTANEGASTSFDLGSFADPDGAPWSVDVDWGDGSSHSTFSAPAPALLGTQSHTYQDNGTYTATVTVTDSTLLSDSKTFMVIVANVAPTPSISGAPASSPEGTAISLTGSATDPSPADTAAGFTFGWSVTKNGNPFTSGSGASFSFTPDDNGSYVLTLTATDKDNGTGSTSTTINVTNVSPTAAINGAPASSPEGTAIALTSTVTDPSSADTTAGFTYAWSVTKNGNPFASGSAASFSFTPDDDGTYVVSLAASDKDGGTGTDSKTITVTNVAPTVGPLSGGDVTILVNQSLTVSTTFSDSGADYPWQATFNWGDGSTPVISPIGPSLGPGVAVPLSLSHSYSSNSVNGPCQVRVDVTDKDGATGSSNLKSVTVIYGVEALFAQSQSGKSYKRGSTIPVKIQILDANGVNMSSAGITVHAAGAIQTSTSANADVLDSGSANPDNDFRYDSSLQGYVFNLSTMDLTTGTWKLSFTVNGQSDASYCVTFDLK
jgi:PKD domain-containing protein